MIFPTTYETALTLTVISMLCWGLWANTYKLTRKWRFELYYFDYALGMLAVALLAAFTYGSMGDELSFQDNLLIAGKRHIAYAFAAGTVFNLGNMLLLGAVSLAGLAVAFPLSLGLALIVGLIWTALLQSMGNPLMLLGGAVLVIAGMFADAIAYGSHVEERSAGKTLVSMRGFVLSLCSGVLLGSFYPLIDLSRAPDIGLGAYTVVVVFAIGVLVTTFIFNLYFMNLPVQGEPIVLISYFKGSIKNHLLGFVGGGVWAAGAIALLLAESAPREVGVPPKMSRIFGNSVALIAMLCGLFLWREFAASSARVKLLVTASFVLFAAGVGLVSRA